MIPEEAGALIEHIVTRLAGSAVLAGLECHLVTVSPAGETGAAALVQPSAILARAGKAAIVLQGETEPAIAGHVISGGIDLLMMGAYGRGRIRTMILGSTTRALPRSCRIPVLVFR